MNTGTKKYRYVLGLAVVFMIAAGGLFLSEQVDAENEWDVIVTAPGYTVELTATGLNETIGPNDQFSTVVGDGTSITIIVKGATGEGLYAVTNQRSATPMTDNLTDLTCTLTINGNSHITFESDTYAVSIDSSNTQGVSWTGVDTGSMAGSETTSINVLKNTILTFTSTISIGGSQAFAMVEGKYVNMTEDGKYDVTVSDDITVTFKVKETATFIIDSAHTGGVSWTGANEGSMPADVEKTIKVPKDEIITFTVTNAPGKTSFIKDQDTFQNYGAEYQIEADGERNITFIEADLCEVTITTNTPVAWTGSNTGSLPAGDSTTIGIPSSETLILTPSSGGSPVFVFIDGIQMVYEAHTYTILPAGISDGVTIEVLEEVEGDFVDLMLYGSNGYWTGNLEWSHGLDWNVQTLYSGAGNETILTHMMSEISIKSNTDSETELWANEKWFMNNRSHKYSFSVSNVTITTMSGKIAEICMAPVPDVYPGSYYMPDFSDWKAGWVDYGGGAGSIQSPDELHGGDADAYRYPFLGWNSMPSGNGTSYYLRQNFDGSTPLYMQYGVSDVVVTVEYLYSFLHSWQQNVPTQFYLNDGQSVDYDIMGLYDQQLFWDLGINNFSLILWTGDENDYAWETFDYNVPLPRGKYLITPLIEMHDMLSTQVNFDPGMGYMDWQSSSISLDFMHTLNLPIPSDVPDGFKFRGWALEDSQSYVLVESGSYVPLRFEFTLLNTMWPYIWDWSTDYYYDNPPFPGTKRLDERYDINKTYMVTNQMISLTAMYGAVDYVTVTYDPNGGVISDGSGKYQDQGSPGYLMNVHSSDNVTKEFYEFAYWCPYPGGSGDENDRYHPGLSYDKTYPQTDLILYAVWRGVNVTVEYTTLEGNGEWTDTKTRTYGGTFEAFSGEGFRNEGYTLRGWSTQPDGDVQYRPGLEYGITSDVVYDGERYVLTLYAVWSENPILFYDANEGTNAPSPNNATSDGAVKLSGVANVSPQRPGYDFIGWSFSEVGGEVHLIGSTVVILEDTIIFAQWKAKEVTLTYDANGGENPPDAVYSSVDKTEVISGLRDMFHPNSLKFLGWCDNDGNWYVGGDKIIMKDNITLYAQWADQDKFYVVFSTNGGVGVQDAIEITNGGITPDGSKLSREGYSFVTWCTSRDGTANNYDPGKTIPASSHDITLYAQWIPDTVYVEYYRNDGTGVKYGIDTTFVDAEYVIADVPVRDGWMFRGWCDSKDGIGHWYYPGNTITVPINGLILHAQWSLSGSPILSYDGNGGNGVPLPSVVDQKKDVTVALGIPSRAGYEFKEWNTMRDGKGLSYSPGALIKNVNSSIILYAQWIKLKADVLYYDDDVLFKTDSSATENILIVAEGPSKDGYTFMGWNTAKDRTGSWYISGDRFSAPPGGLVLYAQWESNDKPILSYNSNNGTGTPAPEIIFDNTKVTSKEPTRVGYTFNGWATGVGTKYNAGDPIQSGVSIVLYAQWVAEEAVVKYNHNNGTGVSEQYILSTDSPHIVIYGPERDEYRFVGWNTKADGSGGAFATDGLLIVPAGGIELFAQWEKVSTGSTAGDDDEDKGPGLNIFVVLASLTGTIVAISMTIVWFRGRN